MCDHFLLEIGRHRYPGRRASCTAWPTPHCGTWSGLPALGLEQVGFIAVDTGAGCVDKLLHAAWPVRFQYIQSALDVILTVEQGHLNGTGYTAPGGLVENIVHTLAGLRTAIQLLNVTLDKSVIGIVQELIHIGLLACGQAIQRPDTLIHVHGQLTQI